MKTKKKFVYNDYQNPESIYLVKFKTNCEILSLFYMYCHGHLKDKNLTHVNYKSIAS